MGDAGGDRQESMNRAHMKTVKDTFFQCSSSPSHAYTLSWAGRWDGAASVKRFWLKLGKTFFTLCWVFISSLCEDGAGGSRATSQNSWSDVSQCATSKLINCLWPCPPGMFFRCVSLNLQQHQHRLLSNAFETLTVSFIRYFFKKLFRFNCISNKIDISRSNLFY